jgi:hypothetical protein
MSLLRLLASGKSLVGVMDSTGRYDVSGRRALPRFGTKKNPFRATARPELMGVALAPATSRVVLNETPALPMGPVVSGLSAPPLQKANPQPAGIAIATSVALAVGPGRAVARAAAPLTEPAPAAVKRAPSQAASGAAKAVLSAKAGKAGPSRLSRWLAELKAWLPRFRPAKPTPQLAKLPAQGEFSLEHIKVVRNDLSDSDLEVVRAKAPQGLGMIVKTAPAAPVAPVERAPAARAGWGRVSARLFDASKTLS